MTLNNQINRRRFIGISGGGLAAAILAACGGGSKSSNSDKQSSASPAASTGASGAASSGPAVSETATLRLGYFPNMTHVQPCVGLENGAYAKQLGTNVTLQTTPFNAGPAAIEALLAGSIDATYVGPSPAVNGYVQSQGKELRIISGATSGGVLFVTRKGFDPKTPADFANKKIATPQLGNTQDVATRAWLKKNGLNAKEQGGNVTIVPTANAQQIQLFQQGQIDASWAPEPWGTRLIQEADGKLYLDERDLWPNKQFVITNLVVRTKYLQDHPGLIENLLRAHVDVTDYINKNPADAKAVLNKRIAKDTNAAIPDKVIEAAWGNQDITFDPIASSLRKAADDAADLGFLDKKPDLTNIYDLTILNKILAEKKLPAVKGFA